jgi:hypothetical protein
MEVDFLKRLSPFLAAIAVLALVSPAAGAERSEFKGTEPAPSVEFTAKIRAGKVVKVSKFKFFDILLQCDQGTLVVNNDRSPLPAMAVDDNRFGDTFTSNNGQKVKVSGKFSNHGNRAEGNLRVRGDFTDQAGTLLTNCDSGKVSWKAGA